MDISTSPPLFLQGIKIRTFAPFFDPTCIPSAVVEKQQKFKNLKQECTAPTSVLSSAADPVQLGPLTLRSIVPNGTPKVRQLEKRLHRSILAARGHITFKCHIISVAPGKLQHCENPLRIEFKTADDAQIFNIQTPISLERLKLYGSNLARRKMVRSRI